jgi:Zn finger protein HypA/HybF involved in hydrogenase expression
MLIQGVKILAKFSQYLGKVNVPCRKCNTMVKAGVFEKIATCPNCHTKWS